MKKTFTIILIAAFALLTISCGDLFSSLSDTKFWVLDFSKDPSEPYRINAEMLASNELCEVWVEKGSASAQQAQNVANEYKKNIYEKMMLAFGWVDKKTGYNVMQYADALGDNNGKLIILLLDIKDGYKNSNDAYVGGYFYLLNHYPDAEVMKIGSRSNESDMIFMDTYPSAVGSKDFYATLAHEMQHLMNFITTSLFRSVINDKNEIDEIFPMDMWIDEGLSAAAEWVYLGEADKERVMWYNEDPTGLISKGDNFYVWENHRESPNAVLNEYATVSIFFHWLRLQFDSDIFYDILTSPYSDYQAVEKAQDYQWSAMMRMWHAANFINDSSSNYGYKGDSLLKSVKANRLDSDAKKWNLYPGEAVYTYTSVNKTVPGNLTNINYIGMNEASVLSSIPAGGTLLTYNVDTRYGSKGLGAASEGELTGEKPPKLPAGAKSSANSRALNTASGPYRIDAGDILRRKGTAHSIESLNKNIKSRSSGAEVKSIPRVSREDIVRYKTSDE